MQSPEDIAPEFPSWPESWKYQDEDVPYGEALLEAMRPFVQDMIVQGLARKTIRRHMGYLWLLGGEIIRDLQIHAQYEDFVAEDALRDAVGSDGGPLCRHIHGDEDQRAFDITCRKLNMFLQKS
jgi:hypothetical protein